MLCHLCVRSARRDRSAAAWHLILTLLVSPAVLTPVWGEDRAGKLAKDANDRAARVESAPSTALLNKKIDNIHFAGAAGKSPALYHLKDKKAVVIVFLSFECPVSTS